MEGRLKIGLAEQAVSVGVAVRKERQREGLIADELVHLHRLRRE